MVIDVDNDHSFVLEKVWVRPAVSKKNALISYRDIRFKKLNEIEGKEQLHC
jgi:hypothetical protein